jgi:hypothetical protein
MTWFSHDTKIKESLNILLIAYDSDVFAVRVTVCAGSDLHACNISDYPALDD